LEFPIRGMKEGLVLEEGILLEASKFRVEQC